MLSFFGQVSLLNGHVVILGDFNMHIDLPELPASRQFINLIDRAGFQQHVNSPTHNRGHTLDLVISRSSDNLIQECNVVDKGMSDHFVINCILNFIKNKPERSRNYR